MSRIVDIRGREIIDSRGNPAYGNDRSANGIYIDGGKGISVDGNVISLCNIGIELASEHSGRRARGGSGPAGCG